MKHILAFILTVWDFIIYTLQIIFTNTVTIENKEVGGKILTIARETMKRPDKLLYFYALKHKFSQAVRFISYNTILSSVIFIYLFKFINWPTGLEIFLSIVFIILAFSVLLLYRGINVTENSLKYYIENYYTENYETIEKLKEENHVRDTVLFDEYIKSHETGKAHKIGMTNFIIYGVTAIIPLIAIIAVNNVPNIIKFIIGICFIALLIYDSTSKLLNDDEHEELDNMSFPPIKE